MHIKKVQSMRYSVFIIVEAPLPKMCSFFLSIFEVLSQQHTHCSIFLNLGNFVKSPCTQKEFCFVHMKWPSISSSLFLKSLIRHGQLLQQNKGPLLKRVLIYLIKYKIFLTSFNMSLKSDRELIIVI